MEVKKVNEKTGDLYTEYEVQAKINEAKAMQKEEMDYSVKGVDYGRKIKRIKRKNYIFYK